MVATTPKQSARLLVCGISPNTADMYLSVNLNEGENYEKYSAHILHTEYTTIEDIMRFRDYSPAWSLSALLTSVLPKHFDDFPVTKWRPPFLEDEICDMDSEGVLNGDVKLYSNGANWIIDYDWDGFSGTLPQSENPIEAVVLAIELLHANGYDFTNIKNENS